MGSQRVAHDWATSLAAHRHLAEQVSWSRRNSPTFSHQAFLFCWVCPTEPPSQWSTVVVWAADTLRVIRKANKQTSKNHCLPVYLEAITYFLIFLFLFICYWSVAKSCVTLWDPMNCSTPGFLTLHHLPEFAQTHVHWVSDAIRPSHPCHPLLLPSVFPSIRVFSSVGSLHQLQLQHQSFQWIFRTDFL